MIVTAFYNLSPLNVAEVFGKHKELVCPPGGQTFDAKGIELIFEVGKQLQIAHDELANHGDGTFGKWCAERCGMTDRTARNYNERKVYALP